MLFFLAIFRYLKMMDIQFKSLILPCCVAAVPLHIRLIGMCVYEHRHVSNFKVNLKNPTSADTRRFYSVNITGSV